MSNKYEVVEDKLLDILVELVKEHINIPEAKRQILATDGIAIVDPKAELPENRYKCHCNQTERDIFSGVNDWGYHAYEEAQQRMLKEGWVKEVK